MAISLPSILSLTIHWTMIGLAFTPAMRKSSFTPKFGNGPVQAFPTLVLDPARVDGCCLIVFPWPMSLDPTIGPLRPLSRVMDPGMSIDASRPSCFASMDRVLHPMWTCVHPSHSILLNQTLWLIVPFVISLQRIASFLISRQQPSCSVDGMID